MASSPFEVLLDPLTYRLAKYHFLTTWRFQAPIRLLWDRIRDYESWPSWWKGVRSARRIPLLGGQGEFGRIEWQAPVGYVFVTEFRETLINAPTEYAGISRGDLVGSGAWSLSEHGGVTTVRYSFDVRTTKWWVRLLSPVARPFFIHEHDALMKQGAEGLARHLRVPLLG